MTPSLSILTAVRDGADYIGEMLMSVREGQPALPHIIVDDGSVDGTADLLRAQSANRDDLTVVTLPQSLGPGAALNTAFRCATTTHCMTMDADDLIEPGHIHRLTDVLEADPTIDLIFSEYHEFSTPEVAKRYAVRTEQAVWYVTSGTVVRRALFDQLGGFDETIRLGFFPDFIVRARAVGAREHIVHELGMRRRVHGANLTIRERHRMTDYLAVARAAAARQRRG